MYSIHMAYIRFLYRDTCVLSFTSRFVQRIAEIRALKDDLRDGMGGAQIDEDGRLVRAPRQPQHQPPQQGDPPPVGGIGANNDNNNPHLDPFANVFNNQQQAPENPEEEFLEQLSRETEATIAIAVREFRTEKVSEDHLEVILLGPRGEPVRPVGFFGLGLNNADEDNSNNSTYFPMGLTVQRLVITFIVAVVAITFALLQVFSFRSMVLLDEPHSPTFDPLLSEVMEVRGWIYHVRHCSSGLANRSEYTLYQNRTVLEKWFGRLRDSVVHNQIGIDCSKGVLHIPSKRILNFDCFDSLMKRDKTENKAPKLPKELKEYAHGVDVSWFIPCIGHPSEKSQTQCSLQETNDGDEQCLWDVHKEAYYSASNKGAPQTLAKCFRGIHDNLIDNREIKAAVSMADALIDHGGDHFDVHYDVSHLDKMVPSIVKKVKTLLDTTYLNHQGTQEIRSTKLNDNILIQPVAFRVLTTGPMDGHDVKVEHHGDTMSMYLAQSSSLNDTNYLDWVLRSRQHNDKAHRESYYRPWPFRLEPKRERCDLKFDLQADLRFCIQTSVFLTSGAGQDFQGGTSLFVDNHPSNFGNSNRPIARGISIDGSRGRVVVSTGGFENLRCRFPTRTGFRTVLQIWWSCENKE